MATQLSKATKDVKKYGIIFGVGIVLITVISWLSTGGGSLISKPTTTVEGYPKADELFNKIPKPELTSITITKDSAALISKTSGDFPTEPPVGYIYKINLEREYAGEAAAARKTAQYLNFNFDETKVINNVMYWETPEKNRYLQYDKSQRLWNYRYANYPQGDSSLLTSNANDYIKIASSFFSALEIDSSNLKNDQGAAEFVQLSSSGSISNISKEPNAVKVALYKSVNLITPTSSDIATPTSLVRKFTYTDGIVNMIINEKGKTIIDNLLQLSYKNYSYGDKGIYNLLEPDEAFVKLQGNEGYLYRIILNNQNEYGTTVTYNVSQYVINAAETQIVYIEPESVNASIPWTTYLQPFYLFKGTFETNDGQSGVCAFLVPALADAAYK